MSGIASLLVTVGVIAGAIILVPLAMWAAAMYRERFGSSERTPKQAAAAGAIWMAGDETVAGSSGCGGGCGAGCGGGCGGG